MLFVTGSCDLCRSRQAARRRHRGSIRYTVLLSWHNRRLVATERGMKGGVGFSEAQIEHAR